MGEGLKLEAFGCRSIRHLDLEVAAGQRLGITGPSGTGKSLLLRAIADLDLHDGRMWLDGVEAGRIPAPYWRRKVALLPSESAWWFDTVGEHFADIPPFGMEQLGFASEVLTWQVGHLSSGERQRLALLRVLANTPRVLLLDEPTANLDEVNTERAEKLIGSYCKAHQPAVVWVGHDLEQLKRCCESIFTLNNGRLNLLEAEAIPV